MFTPRERAWLAALYAGDEPQASRPLPPLVALPDAPAGSTAGGGSDDVRQLLSEGEVEEALRISLLGERLRGAGAVEGV